MDSPPGKSAPVMLFDGRCLFCNGAVQFIMRWEATPVLKFAALQSKGGRALASRSGIIIPKGDVDKLGSFMIVDEDGKAHRRFDAVLYMFYYMGGMWRLFGIFCHLVPTFIGNFFYTLGWDYRYLIQGRSETCVVPNKRLKERLIEFGDEFEEE